MKAFSILLILLCCITHLRAQIKTFERKKKEDPPKEILLPYDSLKSIDDDNLLQHIGQTLYLPSNERARSDKGYRSFYTQVTYDGYRVAIYKHISDQRNYSEYSALAEKYFYVNNIFKSSEPNSRGRERFCMELIIKESNDTVYFPTDDVASLWDFITVGYYEKMRDLHMGKEYIITRNKRRWVLKNLEDGLTPDIPLYTSLKCVDVVVNDDSTFPEVVAILTNDTYGKFYNPTNLIGGGYTLTTADEYKRRKAELAGKYGAANAESILNERVSIGMTAEMCRLSWGKPQHINKTSTGSSVKEQWVYGSSSYLYFTNGRLTSIQN